MNKGSNKCLRWGKRAVAAAGLLLALTGCLQERVVWSPDGSRAAVITREGLRWCDATGRLSTVQIPEVSAAVWLGDGRRLVVARIREFDSWSAIAAALESTRAAALAAEAETIWQRLQDGGIWSVFMILRGEEGNAIKVYLRERHGEKLRAQIGDAWDEVAAARVKLSEIDVAQFVGEKIEAGPAVFAGFEDIIEMRPSPDGRCVMVVVETKGDADVLTLSLASLEAPAPAIAVARNVAAYPDWTPDGRSVVYVQGAGSGSDSEDLSLGVVLRRTVRTADGAIAVAEQGDEMAGVVINPFMRVRCLADGRIVFNALEVTLPMANADADENREQLFALDPERQPTLVRLIPRKAEANLPDMLAFFEVSPDARQIVFGSTKNEVCLLTLASGEVESIQGAAKDDMQGAPTWRGPGEISYFRRLVPTGGEESSRKVELVLRRSGEETVVSRDWPDVVVNSAVE